MGHKRARTYISETKGEKAQREAYTEGIGYFQDLLSQPGFGWQDFMSGTSQPAYDQASRDLDEWQTQRGGRSGFGPLRQGWQEANRAQSQGRLRTAQGADEAAARSRRFSTVEQGAHGKVGIGPGKPTILSVGAKPKSSNTLGQIGSLVGGLGGAFLGGPGFASMLGGAGATNPFSSVLQQGYGMGAMT